MNHDIQKCLGVSLGSKKINIKKQYEKNFSLKLYRKTIVKNWTKEYFLY